MIFKDILLDRKIENYERKTIRDARFLSMPHSSLYHESYIILSNYPTKLKD